MAGGKAKFKLSCVQLTVWTWRRGIDRRENKYALEIMSQRKFAAGEIKQSSVVSEMPMLRTFIPLSTVVSQRCGDSLLTAK